MRIVSHPPKRPTRSRTFLKDPRVSRVRIISTMEMGASSRTPYARPAAVPRRSPKSSSSIPVEATARKPSSKDSWRGSPDPDDPAPRDGLTARNLGLTIGERESSDFSDADTFGP